MSKLLLKPQYHKTNGEILNVNPTSANWEYVGFEVYQLKKGNILEKSTEANEACLVLLTGKADVKTNKESFSAIGNRMNVFEKVPPYSVYVPNEDT